MRGGGGGNVFLAFYAISNISKKNLLEIYLLCKWEVVSPNGRLGQWESTSISNISSIPLL